jgi:hypothetical protein
MAFAANSSAASGTTPAFSAQDFHKAKVFSVQNKNISMDTIIDRTAKLGDLDKALAELKSNPQ